MQQFTLLHNLVRMQSLVALINGDSFNIDIELVESSLGGDREVAH